MRINEELSPIEEAVFLLRSLIILVVVLSIVLTSIWYFSNWKQRRRRRRDDKVQNSLKNEPTDFDTDLKSMNKKSYEDLVSEVESLRAVQSEVRTQLAALQAIVAQKQSSSAAHSEAYREKRE